jgi:hypothetical protein
VKIFGLIEINWARKKPKLSHETSVADVFLALQAMGHIAKQEHHQPRQIRTIPRNRLTDQIVFPEPNDPNDPWEVQRLTNLVRDVEKMFRQGWFSICVLDRAIDGFNLIQTPRSKEAYKKLAILHCVNFNEYVPGIFEQLPDLINCVLSEGRLPLQPVSDSLRITQE